MDCHLITGKTAKLDLQEAAFKRLPQAKAVSREQTAMNKTEELYSEELETLQAAGEIAWWAFQPIALILAKKTRYTPDFCVILPDGVIEFHEVKGFWRDDARVKIKVAADKFAMFRFIAVQRVKKAWKYEVIEPR